jgi:Xaa-Pro aminopeptidase
MAKDPERKKRIFNALESTALRALICFSSADVLLLSGYWPVMGSSVAIFQRDGHVTVLLPEDELDLAMATSEAELVAYRPATLHSITTPAEALVEPIRCLSPKLDIRTGEVGTALEEGRQPSPYLSMHQFGYTVMNLVGQICPTAKIVAADDLLRRLRAVKTAGEISLVRRAANLAQAGFSVAKTAVVSGRREDQVAADIESAFARVANDGFERGHGRFFCMSGPNSVKAAGAFARTRRRVLQEGDVVMIHANTTGDGYWTDITRTYVVGTRNDQQERMFAAIAEARAAALNKVAPGVPAKQVDAAARDVLKQHGFGDAFKHSTGHGVGFAAADANALPRIHPASPDVLEEGMTFNVEPAIYIEGVGGMRHCDVVACTSSGPDVLTDYPQ